MKMSRLQKRSVFASILLIGLATLANWAGNKAFAQPQPKWQLVDDRQKSCISLDVANPDTLYGVWIRGSWTHTITAGLDGADISGYYLPIPPGSSDGKGSLAYVTIAIPADTPKGFYMMSLWADDGTTRESVPIKLKVTANCHPY
jgi:hypothetical protein